MLKQLFDDASVKAILNIPQWSSHQADSWTWIHSSNRDLSVKSTFKEISKSNLLPPNNPILAKIWKAKIHDRLKLFLWRVAAGILPTKDSIAKFVPSSNQVCVLCNEALESTVHIFWECPLARAMWFGSVWGIRTDCIIINNASQLVELIITPPPEIIFAGLCEKKFCLFGALLLDQLWKCRNAKIHDEREVCVDRIVSNVASLFSEHSGLRLESAISPPNIQVPKW